MIAPAQGRPEGDSGRRLSPEVVVWVRCPVSLLNKLSDSLFSPTGRTRDRAFLDAAMAASALVATADGAVSFAERSRLDELLTSVEPLTAHDVHDAADLFRIFAENILAHPEEGRARALKAVESVTGDREAAQLLMRIACAMGRPPGSYSRPGVTQIRRIAKTLGQCDLETGDEETAAALAGESRPYFITVGNHKGGTGKSTTAMHLAVGLMGQRHSVGCIDLDGRQGTLTHYLANRRATLDSTGQDLPMPCFQSLEPAAGRDRQAVEAEECERLEVAVAALVDCDYVILDTPGSDGHLTDLGHARADTLITPLNDSFLDIDVLARVDRQRRLVLGPSVYAQMVREQSERRVASGREPIDWLVMRNRLAQLDAHNTRDMLRLLEQLAERMGFRLQPGLSERVVYRELFFSGLTLLDLPNGKDEARTNPSRWNARKEITELLDAVVRQAVRHGRCAAVS
jgi:chromosome partitioning protein